MPDISVDKTTSKAYDPKPGLPGPESQISWKVNTVGTVTDESSIRFSCKACGKHLRVPITQAGKRGRCPSCHATVVAPNASSHREAQEPRIQFECSDCGKKITVSAKYAGKTGKCPQCKTPLVVPNSHSEADEKPPAEDLSAVGAERSNVVADGEATSRSEIEKPPHRRAIIWTITATGLFECVLAIGGLMIVAIVHDEPVYVILPLVFSLVVSLAVLVAVTAVISLINALMIQIFTHWVCGFKPKYGTAYVACFLGNMAGDLVAVPLGLIFELIDDPPLVISLALITSGFCFLIYVYILGLLLVHPEKGPIGFGRACLVVLLGLLVASIIGGILVAISFLMGFPW